MAGSYRHIVDKDNKFKGIDLIDNLNDAFQALEECYCMITYLTDNDKSKIHEAWLKGYAKGRLECKAELLSYNSFWTGD